MKDLAYFVSSCFDEQQSQRLEQEVLTCYFEALEEGLQRNPDKGLSFQDIRGRWYSLYPVAWADFLRFLKGWSPSHKKIHSYSLAKLQQAFA